MGAILQTVAIEEAQPRPSLCKLADTSDNIDAVALSDKELKKLREKLSDEDILKLGGSVVASRGGKAWASKMAKNQKEFKAIQGERGSRPKPARILARLLDTTRESCACGLHTKKTAKHLFPAWSENGEHCKIVEANGKERACTDKDRKRRVAELRATIEAAKQAKSAKRKASEKK